MSSCELRIDPSRYCAKSAYFVADGTTLFRSNGLLPSMIQTAVTSTKTPGHNGNNSCGAPASANELVPNTSTFDSEFLMMTGSGPVNSSSSDAPVSELNTISGLIDLDLELDLTGAGQLNHVTRNAEREADRKMSTPTPPTNLSTTVSSSSGDQLSEKGTLFDGVTAVVSSVKMPQTSTSPRVAASNTNEFKPIVADSSSANIANSSNSSKNNRDDDDNDDDECEQLAECKSAKTRAFIFDLTSELNERPLGINEGNWKQAAATVPPHATASNASTTASRSHKLFASFDPTQLRFSQEVMFNLDMRDSRLSIKANPNTSSGKVNDVENHADKRY